MQNELKPCPCGNRVEVKYIIGFGVSLLPIINSPFAGTNPAYYIQCDKCGRNMVRRLRMTNVKHRDKCKRDLIEAWNKRYGNGMDKC